MKKHSKKDRDEVIRTLGGENKERQDPIEYVRSALNTILKKSQRKTLKNYDIVSNIAFVEDFFTEVGIIERVVFNDLDKLVSGLRTGARLGYLVRLVGGTCYSGTDTLHVWDLLKSLAVNDDDAVNAYTTTFKAPFFTGHRTTLLVCQAVYAALGKTPVTEGMIHRLDTLKESKYAMAMFRSLSAILTSNTASFVENIGVMVKLNRRQQEYSPVEKLIAINAHGLVNLWRFHTNNSPLPKLNFDLPWDESLYSYVDSDNKSEILSFAQVSIVFNTWVNELPKQINVQNLIDDLKYNVELTSLS